MSNSKKQCFNAPMEKSDPNGTTKTYHSNGQLYTEITRKDYKKHGTEYCYLDTGVLFEERNWVDGKRHGKHIVNHPNGKPLREANYLDDCEHGITTYYHPNGQIDDIFRFAHGEMLSKKEYDEFLLGH